MLNELFYLFINPKNTAVVYSDTTQNNMVFRFSYWKYRLNLAITGMKCLAVEIPYTH